MIAVTDSVLSWRGDPQLKEQVLARITEHERLDTIIQGDHWACGVDGIWRGCTIGCSLRDPSSTEPLDDRAHEMMETTLGVPAWLARLEDSIFEGLAAEDARAWPRRFSEALPIGVELTLDLADRLAIQRLRHGVLPLAPSWPDSMRDQVASAIEQVIAVLGGDQPAASAESAESAA